MTEEVISVKKKLWLIPVVIMVIVAALWLGGIVPEQIGKIFGIKEQYSEIQLEGVENADNHGLKTLTLEKVVATCYII